jgi:hypothetical protein
MNTELQPEDDSHGRDCCITAFAAAHGLRGTLDAVSSFGVLHILAVQAQHSLIPINRS